MISDKEYKIFLRYEKRLVAGIGRGIFLNGEQIIQMATKLAKWQFEQEQREQAKQ
jgi:hypothetical protein